MSTTDMFWNEAVPWNIVEFPRSTTGYYSTTLYDRIEKIKRLNRISITRYTTHYPLTPSECFKTNNDEFPTS